MTIITINLLATYQITNYILYYITSGMSITISINVAEIITKIALLFDVTYCNSLSKCVLTTVIWHTLSVSQSQSPFFLFFYTFQQPVSVSAFDTDTLFCNWQDAKIPWSTWRPVPSTLKCWLGAAWWPGYRMSPCPSSVTWWATMRGHCLCFCHRICHSSRLKRERYFPFLLRLLSYKYVCLCNLVWILNSKSITKTWSKLANTKRFKRMLI